IELVAARGIELHSRLAGYIAAKDGPSDVKHQHIRSVSADPEFGMYVVKGLAQERGIFQEDVPVKAGTTPAGVTTASGHGASDLAPFETRCKLGVLERNSAVPPDFRGQRSEVRSQISDL